MKSSDGKSTWSSVGITLPVNIEDISVQTQALTNVVAYGETPHITPFGVKGKDGRVANITGTYKNRSMVFVRDGMEVISVQDIKSSGYVVNGMAIRVSCDPSFLNPYLLQMYSYLCGDTVPVKNTA